MKKTGLALLLTVMILHRAVCASERLAVLPLIGDGVGDATQATATMLLRLEIERTKKYELVPPSELEPFLAPEGCLETSCAVEIGQRAGAPRVVFGSLHWLGEKVIFQYSLIDVPSATVVLTDNASVMRVEEFDQIAKRAAVSITEEIPFEKTIEVGRVTEQESLEVNRRMANSSWGIGFGYIYPTEGYDGEDRAFVWDFRSIYELRNFAVDALLGLRKGASLNVGFLYLPSRKDFSPYVGAGIGFHAIDHQGYEDYYYGDEPQVEPKSDGFEFLFKAGLMAFRTYDFRVILTGEYSITFNDYDDAGFVVTIGVMRAGKRVFGIF